jgi:hypothetical protein
MTKTKKKTITVQQQVAPEHVREFLLELFPLTDELYNAQPTLADLLYRSALAALLEPQQASEHLMQTEALLQLACDLGYVDSEVMVFLHQQMERRLDRKEGADAPASIPCELRLVRAGRFGSTRDGRR